MQNKWEEAKTPTPTHPIPLDTQMYIQELESRFDRIVERLEDEKMRLRKLKNDCIALCDSEVIAIEEQAYNFAIEIVKGGVDNGQIN